MERAPESTVTAKGQITIPKAVRDRLNIGPGDRVKFFFDAHGKLVILPKIPTASLAGIVGSRLGRPVTLEEMEEGIAAGAVGNFKYR